MTQPLLEVRGLGKRFRRAGSTVTALDGINLQLYPGETLALVKETQKVTGFVGSSTNPPSVPEREVRRITEQIEEVSSMESLLSMITRAGESGLLFVEQFLAGAPAAAE